MLRIQITNTPELPVKKIPTFKRLWHMALQLWYHRQIIKRYKARPIKYKKAYHSVLQQRDALSTKYGLAKLVENKVRREREQDTEVSKKYERRISELDNKANYYREFIATVARCTGPEINDLPNGAKAILKGEQDLHPH